MAERIVYILAPDSESRLQCAAELVRKISRAGGESIVTASKDSLENTIGSFMNIDKLHAAIIREHQANSGECTPEQIEELKGDNCSVVVLKESVGPEALISKKIVSFLEDNDIKFSWVDKEDFFYWEWPDRILEQDPSIIKGL